MIGVKVEIIVFIASSALYLIIVNTIADANNAVQIKFNRGQ